MNDIFVYCFGNNYTERLHHIFVWVYDNDSCQSLLFHNLLLDRMNHAQEDNDTGQISVTQFNATLRMIL